MKNLYPLSQFLNLRMDVKSLSTGSVDSWKRLTKHVERLSSWYLLLRGKGNKLSRRFSRNFSRDSSQIRAPTRPCNLTGADCASAIIIQASDRDDIAVAALGVLKISLVPLGSPVPQLLHCGQVTLNLRPFPRPSFPLFANTKRALFRSSPPSYN